MKELRKKVDWLVENELVRANRKFPLFHSDHEALGVILEEVAEASDECNLVEIATSLFKDSVFGDLEDETKETFIEDIERSAINLACEAIQVAAMAKKWKLGKDSGKDSLTQEYADHLCDTCPEAYEDNVRGIANAAYDAIKRMPEGCKEIEIINDDMTVTVKIEHRNEEEKDA